MILSAREGLIALYHRLIRGKLLQEHAFGQPTAQSRLFYLGLVYGLLFSAPAIAFMLWYAGLAVSTHLRQQAATKSHEEFTLELFQLHLHDRLSADLRRLSMPEPEASSALPTYGLVLSNDKFDKLDRTLPPDEGKGNYVEATMQHKNKLYEVEVRYRGTKPWHWNHPQKSWKVRVKGNHVMFDGLPTFNFINTPDPMPFNEQMVLDTARSVGLLTPAYYPFRLSLNNADLGVYFFEGQPDEGLLRSERRMPGSIYSGAGAPINPKTKISSLWESAANWKKVDAIGDKAMLVRPELSALISVVNNGNFREFADFARDAIDVDKFAALDAIDVVFGNNQHDYHQNHKLYFDPYKNRFEPIATDFRDMEHEREFNRTENPLLLRLKSLPYYITRRNRKVYELIRTCCSKAGLTDEVTHWLDRLRPDQERDPYWDAYELLPVMGTYYRQLVRPMNLERQSVAAQVRLSALAERVQFLQSEIEQQQVAAKLYRPPTSPSATTREAVLDITVGGHAGFEWQSVVPESDARCEFTELQIHADSDLDRRYTEGKDLRLTSVAPPLQVGKPEVTLYPGVALQEIPLHPYRGRVRAVSEPRSYRFFIRSQGCMPHRFRLEGRNAATLMHSTFTVEASAGSPPPYSADCDERPGFLEPGRSSPHPFCYPVVAETTLRLGPGDIHFAETRIFPRNQTVVIEPGTNLRFAEGASLIAYGRFMAEGRADAPIHFLPEHALWGGIALQGIGTAGSRFSYVEVEQGTHAENRIFDFPGMVSIHDTEDIRLEHVKMARNEVSDDALHVAYVDDITIADSRFERVFSDAIDLEYSHAKVDRTIVERAGDDGLDLMGTRVEVSDARLVGCKGNAVSAGERSDVLMRRTLLANSTRGLLLKNGSSVTATEVLLHRNHTGIRLEPETGWYPFASTLIADGLTVVQSRLALDGLKKAKSGTIKTSLEADDLPNLKRAILRDGDWSELAPVLERPDAGSVP